MSIIQNIRDKAAWIIIGAIALALIAFIAQDAFQNRGSLGENSTTLGEINGQEVNAIEFEQRVNMAEQQYRTAGYPLNDMMRENIRESLWNEYVENAILSEKYEDLGIQVLDREVNEILFGDNPPQDLRQQFTDPNTGQYDANAASQQIMQLKKQKNSPMYNSFFNQYIPALQRARQKEKYISLISNSVYVPKWLLERSNVDNSQQASISYVSIPYNTISDSAVQVSDSEIKSYISEREEEFRQQTSRSFNYVVFDAAPTSADSAAALNELTAVRSEFASTPEVEAFLVRNGTETPYYNGYVQSSKLQIPEVDSIRNLAVGSVYGPYIDGGNYVLARMMDKRSMPDSVTVRHILIKTGNLRAPGPDDSTARRRIDSIATAARTGANFDTLAARLSEDEGSKNNGGEYTFSSVQFSNLSREFAEVAFYGKTGDKEIVKVDNEAYSGYHYIEVLNQKNFEQAYNVAYLSRPILPSDQTENNAMGLASQFAGNSRNKEQFDVNLNKANLVPFSATDIRPLESNIAGLGSSRELVRWAYDAKVGDVRETPIKIEDKYVVPVLTAAYEEGLMPVSVARPLVEGIIRNRKKAEQIKAKLGNVASLESAAQSTGQVVAKADSISFANPFIPNVGQEPKLVGAAFNKANVNKVSSPIAGTAAVFLVRVDNVSAVPNPDFDIVQQQAAYLQFQQRSLSDPRVLVEILKKDATIKDERHKFF